MVAHPPRITGHAFAGGAAQRQAIHHHGEPAGASSPECSSNGVDRGTWSMHEPDDGAAVVDAVNVHHDCIA